MFKSALQPIKQAKISAEEIIALLPGNIYWLDRNGIFLGCNNNMLKTIGLNSLDQYVGKTYEDLYESDHIQIIKQTDKKVMEEDKPIAIEEVAIQPGKEPIFYLTKKVPLHDAKGSVIGLLGISFDITDRKRAEQELQAAKEAVEVANNAKTEFLDNMRHDLRTPFVGLLGFAELLEADETDPQKKESLSYIVQSAKTLLDYLNEILEFIYIGKGQLPILEKQFDVYETVQEVITMLIPAAEAKGLELSLKQDAHVPKYVIGDKSRIQKILINLISNSIKFTEQGYVRVEIVMVKEQERQVIIEFIVSDTGVGIPEDKQNVVFEQFNRLTSSYSGVYAGKGLGLRIVKQLLDEIGGEAHLSSKIGEGSVFKILVPYKKSLLGSSE